MEKYYEGFQSRVFKYKSEAKNTFNTFNAKEKSYYWKYKIYRFIKENPLTDEQFALLNELYEQFNDSTYELNSSENSSFINFSSTWLDKAVKHFSDLELYFLVASLRNDINISGSSADMQMKSSGCECNTDSRYTCGRITSIMDGGIEYGDCNMGWCETSTGGCGFAWASYCDGSDCSY